MINPNDKDNINEKIIVFFIFPGFRTDNHKDGKPKNNSMETKKLTLNTKDITVETIGNKTNKAISTFFIFIFSGPCHGGGYRGRTC